MILVDTDVLIDFLRGYPEAVIWFESLGDTPILLCGLSALELLDGCRNRQEADRLLQLLTPYRIVWPGSRDSDRVLIGETAVGLGLPLHTFNVRHFRAIPGLQVAQPYPRSKQRP